MSDAAPVPAPTTVGADPTNHSPPSEIRSTVLYPSGPDPTTTLALFSAVPRNTPTPVATNTSVDPTESLKTFFNEIIEAIFFLTSTMSYEPKTVLLRLEEIRQEIKDSATNYQAAMPHPIKYLLRSITALLNILTRNLQDHQYHPSTALDINPYLKSEAELKPHHF